MQRSDYTFAPLSYEQYTAIITSGEFPGTNSPMLNRPDYDSLIAVMQPANIDPRLPLAFTWAEGHDGTDTGLVAAVVNNLGGIKYVGAAGTTDSGIPADTGGTYAAFADLSVYWREWVRIMNNSIIGPSFNAGDLIGAVEHYTNGPGTGHNKVAKWQEYVLAYPPSSTAGSITGSTHVVTNYDLIRVARAHVGEQYNDMTLDPWNRAIWGDTSPWAGECEAFGEGVPAFLGVPVVHHLDAAECVDAVQAQGLAQTSWPPKHGAACGWGRSFDPHGHRCYWDAEKQMFVTTIITPSSVGYFYSDAWRNAMACWWEVPGVVYLDAAPVVSPTPVTPPTPPAPVPTGPFFIDGNPHGQIPIALWAWARWDALNTMGTKLDHTGMVNAKGLALPQIGYAKAAELVVNGRRIQQFERGYLATGDGPDPFDVVMLTLADIAALVTPAPALASSAPTSTAVPASQPARH